MQMNPSGLPDRDIALKPAEPFVSFKGFIGPWGMKRSSGSRSSSSSSRSSSTSVEELCRKAAANRLAQESPERDEPSQPQPNTIAKRDLSPSMQRLLLEHGQGVLTETDLQCRGVFHARDLAYGWETHELLAFPNSQPWLHLHRHTLDHVERATSSRARLAHVATTLVPKQAQPPQLSVQRTGSTASVGTSARNVLRATVEARPSKMTKPDQPAPVAQVLFELMMANTEHSTQAQQLTTCPPSMLHELKHMWMLKLGSFSKETLRNAASAWRRWCSWTQRQQPPVLKLPASGACLALFARQVFLGSDVKRRNAGGRGAVASVLAGLRFLHHHLGLDLQVQDKLLDAAAADADEQPLKQAVPLQPRDLAVLEMLMGSPNEVVSYLSGCALVLTYGGVRFRHLQRSFPVETRSDGVVFRCEQGKVRRRGQPAPPFDWFLPKDGVWTNDLAGTVLQQWRKLTGGKSRFLVPVLWPFRASLEQAKGFVVMAASTGAWNNMVKHLVVLNMGGWPLREGPTPTSYSSRRLLSTVAAALQMDSEERLALGAWQSDGRNGKRSSMPVRYTDQPVRLEAQVRAKQRVMCALRTMAAAHGANIFQQAWADNFDVLRGCTGDRIDPVPLSARVGGSQLQPSSHILSGPDEDSEPTSSSDSEATSSAPESDDVSDRTVEWCTPSGPQGKLHRCHPFKVTSNGFTRPVCCTLRDNPVSGTGVDDAMRRFPYRSWCPRCCQDLLLKTGKLPSTGDTLEP